MTFQEAFDIAQNSPTTIDRDGLRLRLLSRGATQEEVKTLVDEVFAQFGFEKAPQARGGLIDLEE